MTDSVQAAGPVFQGGEEVETTKGRKHITVKTLAQLTAQHGFGVLEHLEAEAQVPVLSGLQAQGDLFIIPVSHAGADRIRRRSGERVEIPLAGIAAIEAIGGGHEHRLFASQPCTAWWTPLGSGQDIGLLECDEPVYSLHVEHGAAGIAASGPDAYVLRRQREQADEERLVAD